MRQPTRTTEIPFIGNYWWGSEKNVTDPLSELFHKILGATRITNIEIRGTDFNDGREGRRIKIEVEDNKIVVTEEFW